MKKVSMIQDEISGLLFPSMSAYTDYHNRKNGKKPSLFRQVMIDVADDSDALKAFFDGFSKRFAALQAVQGWDRMSGDALENVILHDLEYIYMGFKSGEAAFTENACYRFMAHFVIYMNRRRPQNDGK